MNKWKKVVLISFIIVIIAFILTTILSLTYTLGIVYDLTRMVFGIALCIYLIGIVACTIIAKKNNEKLKGWLKNLQTITIVIVCTSVIMIIVSMISNYNEEDKFEKNYKNTTQTKTSTDPSDYGLPDNYKIPTDEELKDLLKVK